MLSSNSIRDLLGDSETAQICRSGAQNATSTQWLQQYRRYELLEPLLKSTQPTAEVPPLLCCVRACTASEGAALRSLVERQIDGQACTYGTGTYAFMVLFERSEFLIDTRYL